MTNQFGPWEVIERLTSTHPHVFKVRIANQSAGKYYVLKTVKESRLLDFKREVEIVRQLKHRNVLQLIDYDLNPIQPYFVTPFYNMGSLYDIDYSGWNAAKRKSICQQIIRGYTYLNKKKIAKFDHSKKNIFIDNKNGVHQAVIGDFEGSAEDATTDTIAKEWMKVFELINNIMKLKKPQLVPGALSVIW